jgi:hypothetical protein
MGMTTPPPVRRVPLTSHRDGRASKKRERAVISRPETIQTRVETRSAKTIRIRRENKSPTPVKLKETDSGPA